MAGKINIPVFCVRDESMDRHTAFRIGGPADYFCTPSTTEELEEAVAFSRDHSLPLTLIGDGSNILVADKGIRGVVVSLRGFAGYSFERENILSAGAGAPVSSLSEEAAKRSLSGIEFFYSLPGSLGGAVYMNARCYGASTADVLTAVRWMDENGDVRLSTAEECEFGYKTSVFQGNGGTILGAEIKLHPGESHRIREEMEEYKRDREAKGHFAYPCAGSVFKNNRAFGEPSGKIIDSLGLRGFAVGDAQISPLHANIIINRGNAGAKEVRSLIEMIKEKVENAYGYRLEEEIRFYGDF